MRKDWGMFSILENQGASCDELAKGIIRIEKYEKEKLEEYKKVRSRVVTLQQKILSVGDVKGPEKEFQQARSEMTNLEIVLEACTNGVSALRERIIQKMPDEARKRLSTNEKRFQKLSDEEDRLFDVFLVCMAKTVVAWEKIYGVKKSYDSHKGELRDDFPNVPELKYSSLGMNDDRVKRYLDEISKERARANGYQAIKDRKENLLSENDNLNQIIDSYKPDAEIEKLLTKHGQSSAVK
jgi:hypothetical protein